MSKEKKVILSMEEYESLVEYKDKFNELEKNAISENRYIVKTDYYPYVNLSLCPSVSVYTTDEVIEELNQEINRLSDISIRNLHTYEEQAFNDSKIQEELKKKIKQLNNKIDTFEKELSKTIHGKRFLKKYYKK